MINLESLMCSCNYKEYLFDMLLFSRNLAFAVYLYNLPHTLLCSCSYNYDLLSLETLSLDFVVSPVATFQCPRQLSYYSNTLLSAGFPGPPSSNFSLPITKCALSIYEENFLIGAASVQASENLNCRTGSAGLSHFCNIFSNEPHVCYKLAKHDTKRFADLCRD